MHCFINHLMSTILYDSPVFGPIHSRRLGISLGVNLMPADGKICAFDCIYCECGYNHDRIPHSRRPTREEVAKGLEARLRKMRNLQQLPDVITFAGNGEPTAHPEFPEIIEDTLRLRNEYCPQAKVSVLSNATMLARPGVHAALMRIDNNIQKLDTVDTAYIKKVDRPSQTSYRVNQVIEQLKDFHGHVIIQTMFLKGSIDGEDVDNTGDAYVKPWLRVLAEIQPRQVMVYTIDRETPDKDLRKAAPEELDAISDKVRSLGILCETSY